MATDKGLRLLAIDPGGTTGCAVKIDGAYKAFTLDNPSELYHLIYDSHWTAIAYENFTSAGNINQYGHHTIRLCGAIEAICTLKGIPYFVHMPQNRYAYMSKAKVIVGRAVIHQADAMAHLLLLERRVMRERVLELSREGVQNEST